MLRGQLETVLPRDVDALGPGILYAEPHTLRGQFVDLHLQPIAVVPPHLVGCTFEENEIYGHRMFLSV